MKYLPENTQKIVEIEIKDTLFLFDLNDDEKEKTQINNILPGKYNIFQNIVSDDTEDDCRSVFIHAFILHESISQDLNIHNWSKKDSIFFDTSVDEGYVGLFNSPKGLEEFKKKNVSFEEATVNPEMVQNFESGLAFCFPFADYGNPIEIMKLEEKIVGFRIQGIGKDFHLEPNNNNNKPKFKK